MKEFIYKLAERFFGPELDDTYEMGVREGIRHTCSTLYFDMKMRETHLTKTQQATWNKAIEMVLDFNQKNGGR